MSPRMSRTVAASLLIPLFAASLGGCPTGLEAASLGLAGGGPAGALVGTWRCSFTDPTYGPAQIELILMQNGRFQQQTAYAAGALVTIFGTFRVFQGEALLRLDIERGEPAQACGPLGCTTIIYPAGESHGYTLDGANTLVLTNLNCDPTAGFCTFAYGRVN